MAKSSKAPDAEPQDAGDDPPKGESNGYAKARCGYEYFGKDADTRAEAHGARCRLCKKLAEDLMSPRHTPSNQENGDDEAAEIRRQRVRTHEEVLLEKERLDLERVRNPPTPSPSDPLLQKVVDRLDAQGRVLEKLADRLEDGHSARTPAADPTVTAIMSQNTALLQAILTREKEAPSHSVVASGETMITMEYRAALDKLRERLDSKQIDETVAKATGGVYAAVEQLKKELEAAKATARDPGIERDVKMIENGFGLVQQELANVSKKTDMAMGMLAPLVRKIANEPPPPPQDAIDGSALLLSEDAGEAAVQIAEAAERASAKLEAARARVHDLP